MARLPDPTVPLDWSGYAGSIQSHFSKIAEGHPDRICVTETASLESPERSFTYRQIYEASNTLAHYLCDHGVHVGDTVMIFAYRSVELVISMMGILVSRYCLLFSTTQRTNGCPGIRGDIERS
jgi:L-2-aminoadipate reductase